MPESDQPLQPSATNRRAGFRINDRVLLEWRVLADPHFSAEAISGLFHPAPYQSLRLRLSDAEKGFQDCQNRLAKKDPVCVEALSWLDSRINTLSDLMFTLIQHTGEDSDLTETEVSLSTEGIGFISETALRPGAWIALRLVLLPQQESVTIKATITRCEPLSDRNGYLTGVQFVELDSQTERLLARHLLQQQIKQTSRP